MLVLMKLGTRVLLVGWSKLGVILSTFRSIQLFLYSRFLALFFCFCYYCNVQYNVQQVSCVAFREFSLGREHHVFKAQGGVNVRGGRRRRRVLLWLGRKFDGIQAMFLAGLYGWFYMPTNI